MIVMFTWYGRHHAVSSVPKSNLYLVVINGTCGPCSEFVKTMAVPGEPTENILLEQSARF